MAPTQPDFVRAVLDRLGITQTDLGRLLRYPQPYQDAHRLLVGGRNLSYDDTMLLLERCGWLNMGEAEPAISSPASQGVDHLEEIAAALKDLTESQAEILRRLPPGDADALPPARPKRK